MKKSVIILSIVLISNYLNAQELKLNIGYQNIFIDNISGPMLGLSLIDINNKISLDYQMSVVFNFGEKKDVNPPYSTYEIINLKKINTIDLSYKMKGIKSKEFGIGLGYGWLYSGDGNNNLFNRENGFSAITCKMFHEFFWLDVILRGYIPVDKDFDLGLKESISPISLSIVYTIPSKKEKK